MNRVANEHITAYRVPMHDEDPTDEMIEWLHSSPLSWDGDESGICFHALAAPNGWVGERIAAPGDWIVHIHAGNQWILLPAASWSGLRSLTTVMSGV